MKTIKKLMTLLLAVLFSFPAIAQEYEYVPFVREGVKWVYYYDNPIEGMSYEDGFIPSGRHYYTLEMKGDTTINGKVFKPVHLYSGTSINNENDTVPVYLREENKVVYGIIPDETRYWECPIGIGTMINGAELFSNIIIGVEFVLYDFNDPVSFYTDYVANITMYQLHFMSVENILIGDQLRKKFVFNHVNSNDNCEYIIEGLGFVGDSPGMPLNYFYGITTGTTQIINYLSHVIENGEIVYKTKWFEEPGTDNYEYVPFVREGVKWVYRIQYFDYSSHWYENPAWGDNFTYRTLELKGDTVINGKTYKAIHKYSGNAIDEENDTIPVYLREEDKIVYGIVPDGKVYSDCPIVKQEDFDFLNTVQNGEEFVLYDFKNPVEYWTELATTNYSNPDDDSNYLIYFNTDTIAIGSHLAKRYSGKCSQGNREFEVIEGLGVMGNNNYTLGLLMPFIASIYTELYSIEKIIENGEVIYPHNFVEDRYLPIIRENVKWVFERVTVDDGDTTSCYYSYYFKGNYPRTDSHLVCKAMYRQDMDINAGPETLIASLREDECNISSYENDPLNSVMSEGRNLISFYYVNYYGSRILYDMTKYNARAYYIGNQREQFLNQDNFIQVEPLEIDGVMCDRYAYIGDNGNVIAYVIEGIGFDSYDMGDLLTPFTKKPDPDADHQEWCGLSHVIKDGKIIYKGMRFNPALISISGDVNGDGEVNIADANSVIDIVVMGGNSGHSRAPAADVNDDGEINIADVNAIINIILDIVEQ